MEKRNLSAPFVDTVVIGGGITGAATAWHLSRLGAGKVIVLERGCLAGSATAKAATLLSLARDKGFLIPWVRATYQMIDEATDGDAAQVGFARVGAVHAAATEAGVKAIDETARVSMAGGVSGRVLERGELRERVPWIDADSVEKAWWYDEEAFVDAYLLTTRLLNAARPRGCSCRAGVEIKRIRVENGRVAGVETDDGFIPAASVVLAAGVYANLLLAEHGLSLPFAPVRSQYWITETRPERFSPRHPITLLPDARAYTRPENGGLIIGWREPAGKTVHPGEIPADTARYRFTDDQNGWENWAGCAEAMTPYLPGIADLGLAHYITGFSGYAPDSLFTVGTFPEIEGLVAAAGCSGMGIALSGGIGQAAAELVCGQPATLPVEPFSPARMGAVDVFSASFAEQCAMARSRKLTN